MRQDCNNKGFTLIEVLIAMTLLGIMLVLLFSTMQTSSESWQKGEDKIAQVNEIAVVYQFFQNHLSTALPLWDDFTDPTNRVFSFQGQNQEIQFVSSFPASAKKAGLQLFTLKLLKDEEGNYINVAIRPFFPVQEGEEWRKEEVTLMRNVKSFNISYYGSEDPQTEAYWQEVWQLTVPPRLVKIAIEREDGNFWPTMMIGIKHADPNAVGENQEDAIQEDQGQDIDYDNTDNIGEGVQ